jgi:hypothetical protein
VNKTGAKAMTARQLDAALTKWKARCTNPLILAAVTLVQEDEDWLHHPEFRDRCVHVGGDGRPESAGKAMIVWAEVRKFLDGDVRGTRDQIAMLEFACSLAQDRFGWAAMGWVHREVLLRAVTTALEA